MRESGLKFIIFFVFSPNYRKGGVLCPPASCKSTLISFIAIGLMTDDFFAISMEEKKLYIVGDRGTFAATQMEIKHTWFDDFYRSL